MESKQFKIPFLTMLDIFGVPYSHSIKMNQKSQKSILGAITSIILVTISLCYLIYVMEQWLSLKMLPKTSNTMRVEQFSAIDLHEEEPIVSFSFGKYSEQHRNPFNMQGNILMPIAIYFENGKPSTPLILQNQKLNSLKLIQNSLQDSNLQATTELVIMISRCQSEYMQDGNYCASDSEIDDFFTKSVNYMDFWINLKQFNPHKQEFEVVRKQYYFWFDSQSAQMGQLMVKQAYLQVDTGVLFNDYSDYKCIQDSQIMMTNTQKTLWQPLINSETYLSLIFRLDPVSFDIQIVYPKLGEILAQVGSIVNLLMITKYLVQHYNQQLLENKLIDKLIQFYYSDYNLIKKSKEKKDKAQIELLKQKARKKLIFQNILYELSRIELFLLNQFGRITLEQAHGYRIQCRESEDNIIESAKQNSDNLDQQLDFTMFSKPRKCDKIHPL